MNKEQAIDILLGKVKSLKCWQEYQCGRNTIAFEDSTDPIPPYIPQIGGNYFDSNNYPKILMYAMNQNLHGALPIVKTYTELWKSNRQDKVYDRLNGISKGKTFNVEVNIGPYPHMNMLARLLIYALKDKILNYENCIENTAATNLIKCSTTVNASTPNLIMYGNCSRKTCLYEIELLKPNAIIAMGSEVFYSLVHTLGFRICDQCGLFAQPNIEDIKSLLPLLIIYAYHSTGPIRSHFKALQNHFDKGEKKPEACRPYLTMLTGKNFEDCSNYWALAKSRYEENRDILQTHYSDFFEQENKWYGSNRDFLFYFACHLALFRRLSIKASRSSPLGT